MPELEGHDDPVEVDPEYIPVWDQSGDISMTNCWRRVDKNTTNDSETTK